MRVGFVLTLLFFLGGKFCMEVKDMGKRPGDKTKRLNVRLTEMELDQLNAIVEKTGKSKTEIIREGIRMKFDLSKANMNLDI